MTYSSDKFTYLDWCIGVIATLLICTIPFIYFYSRAHSNRDSLFTIPLGEIYVDKNPKNLQSSKDPAVINQAIKQSKNLANNSENIVPLLNEDPTVQPDDFLMCQIAAVTFNFPNIEATTLQNLRIQSCNVKEFKAISLASIAAQLATKFKPFLTSAAGPYRGTATKDLFKSSSPFIYIGSQRFTEAYKVKIGILDLIKHPEFVLGGDIFQDALYYPLYTKENVSLFWSPGKIAYCLVNPKGEVFIMTHYSLELFPDLNLDNLEDLKALLLIPKNWKFIKAPIIKPVWINHSIAEGFTVVRLVDNLGNFYLKLNNIDMLDIKK
jgi:hypothetical protein